MPTLTVHPGATVSFDAGAACLFGGNDAAISFAPAAGAQFDFSPYLVTFQAGDTAHQILDSQGEVLMGADGNILWGVDQ